MKREVASAGEARELLARMGYSSIEIKGGDNKKITSSDFRIAHDICNKDVTSMRGKKKKRKSGAAEMTVVAQSAQKQHVLSVDIMSVDKTHEK